MLRFCIRGSMRRILVSSTLLAVLSLTVLVSVPPVHSQSKPKAGKAVAAAPASYGNVDSIGEEEMKIYLYFLASDQLEGRSEEHTSELQSLRHLVCRLLLEKK